MHPPDFKKPLPTHYLTGFRIPPSAWTLYWWDWHIGRWDAVLSTTLLRDCVHFRDGMREWLDDRGIEHCYRILKSYDY